MSIVHQACSQALFTKEQAQALLSTIGPEHKVPESVKEHTVVCFPIRYEKGAKDGELIKLCSVLQVRKFKVFDDKGKGRYMWLIEWGHGLVV